MATDIIKIYRHRRKAVFNALYVRLGLVVVLCRPTVRPPGIHFLVAPAIPTTRHPDLAIWQTVIPTAPAARDHNRFIRFGLANIEQTEVCVKPGS